MEIWNRNKYRNEVSDMLNLTKEHVWLSEETYESESSIIQPKDIIEGVQNPKVR